MKHAQTIPLKLGLHVHVHLHKNALSVVFPYPTHKLCKHSLGYHFSVIVRTFKTILGLETCRAAITGTCSLWRTYHAYLYLH